MLLLAVLVVVEVSCIPEEMAAAAMERTYSPESYSYDDDNDDDDDDEKDVTVVRYGDIVLIISSCRDGLEG